MTGVRPQPPDGDPERVDVEEILAEHDEERPARRLTGPLDVFVTAVCGLISVAVLVRVFLPDPLGAQHHRMLFLVAVLPLTLLCFRPGVRRVPAAAGTHSFTKAQPVKALMRIYDNTTQVIVRADSGIASIADMRGKTISTGSANSGTEVIATRLLEVNGLKPTDITQNKAALDDTVDGMKDGSIKGMFWSGGLPTAGVKDLLASLGPAGVKFLDLSADLPKMQQAYGGAYRTGTIPAGAYGTGSDVPTILVANVLMVNERMSDKLAGDLVRLIFAKKPDLEKIHPEAKNITLDQAALTGDIPLHPGADKALTELGAKRK